MNILITGGSSDIAQSIAKRRLLLGDQVIITSSSEQSLIETLAVYKAQKLLVKGMVYDFAQPEACKADLEDLLQERVDGLILNAFTRVTQLRKLHALPFNAVTSYIDINLQGNIWLMQQVLRPMLTQQFGRIILISSLSAAAGTSRYPAYCAAKAALEGLLLNLAVDYGAHHILSNIMRVGLIKTSRTEQFWSNPAYQEKMNAIIPQGAMGEPDQVAEALDPLLSKTSYINGSVLTVSGGLPLMRSAGLLS